MIFRARRRARVLRGLRRREVRVRRLEPARERRRVERRAELAEVLVALRDLPEEEVGLGPHARRRVRAAGRRTAARTPRSPRRTRPCRPRARPREGGATRAARGRTCRRGTGRPSRHASQPAAERPRAGDRVRPWLGWPCAFRTGQRAAEAAPGEPGRLPLPGRARTTCSTSARRSRCARACASTSRPGASDNRAGHRPARRPRRPTIETIVTGTEVEALHLEQNLVKRHRPPFNVRLRDDKSFPYIAVTRRGRLPARHVHARAAPARRRLLRPVREREEGARDARRAEPRLPLPAVRGPAARAAQRHPVPRLPHRALPRAVRRLHLEGGLPAS